MSVRIQPLEKRGADHRYISTLAEFWGKLQPLIPDHKLILAVSGGVDSLSLLHWAAHQTLIPKKQLVAATIDHQLRPQSHQEAVQVGELAQQWGIRFISRHFDTDALAKETRKSVEDAARIGRYRLLAEIAAEVGASWIVTGHHMGDQAETLLLHLLRGTGSRGLQGMRPISSVPGDSTGRLQLLRPLLSCTRQDIEAYAHLHQLRPLEDLSNQDQRFVRNRIRHELLPTLAEYNPQIVKTLSQLADQLQQERPLLDAVFDEAWREIAIEHVEGDVKLDLNKFAAAPIAVQRYLLREVVLQLSGSLENVSFDVIEQARHIVLRRETGLTADLGRHIQVEVSYNIVEGRSRLSDEAESPVGINPQLPPDAAQIPLDKGLSQQIELSAGYKMTIMPISTGDVDLDLAAANDWLAFLAIERFSQVEIRRRKSGERFIPFGFEGHIKLKKLMIDRKIPAKVRDNWPIVADQFGVLWVPGLRLAQRAAVEVGQADRQILKIEITRGRE